MLVNHPELVADHDLRFADLIGRDGDRLDQLPPRRPPPADHLAKLEALAQGATLASKRLWRWLVHGASRSGRPARPYR